jgi:hypothetical protein
MFLLGVDSVSYFAISTLIIDVSMKINWVFLSVLKIHFKWGIGGKLFKWHTYDLTIIWYQLFSHLPKYNLGNSSLSTNEYYIMGDTCMCFIIIFLKTNVWMPRINQLIWNQVAYRVQSIKSIKKSHLMWIN